MLFLAAAVASHSTDQFLPVALFKYPDPTASPLVMIRLAKSRIAGCRERGGRVELSSNATLHPFNFLFVIAPGIAGNLALQDCIGHSQDRYEPEEAQCLEDQ